MTQFDPEPNAQIEDIIDRLSRAKLTKGYWQMLLDDHAKGKSAFITPFGHDQFTVMPAVVINSAITFNKLVIYILAGNEEFVDSFIAEKIFSEDSDSHFDHIKSVFKSIQDAGLTANP